MNKAEVLSTLASIGSEKPPSEPQNLQLLQPLSIPLLTRKNQMSTPRLARAATRQIPAVVVSAGLMQKTVKVRVGYQQWNAHIRKASLLSPRAILALLTPWAEVLPHENPPRPRSGVLPAHRRHRVRLARLAGLEARAPRRGGHHRAVWGAGRGEAAGA